MQLMAILRNMGLKEVHINLDRDVLHISHSNPLIKDDDIAAELKVPIYINGEPYNLKPNQEGTH